MKVFGLLIVILFIQVTVSGVVPRPDTVVVGAPCDSSVGILEDLCSASCVDGRFNAKQCCAGMCWCVDENNGENISSVEAMPEMEFHIDCSLQQPILTEGTEKPDSLEELGSGAKRV